MSRRVDFCEASCSAVGPNSSVIQPHPPCHKPPMLLCPPNSAKLREGCTNARGCGNRVQVVASFPENFRRQFSVDRWCLVGTENKNGRDVVRRRVSLRSALHPPSNGNRVQQISSKSGLSIGDRFFSFFAFGTFLLGSATSYIAKTLSRKTLRKKS